MKWKKYSSDFYILSLISLDNLDFILSTTLQK